jgi:hypothetical protein
MMGSPSPKWSCYLPSCTASYINTHIWEKFRKLDGGKTKGYGSNSSLILWKRTSRYFECPSCAYLTDATDWRQNHWRCGELVPASLLRDYQSKDFCCSATWCVKCDPLHATSKPCGGATDPQSIFKKFLLLVEAQLELAAASFCPGFLKGSCTFNTPVQKETACNSMTCKQCRAQWCNLCSAAIPSGLSFSSATHKPIKGVNKPCGQGDDDSSAYHHRKVNELEKLLVAFRSQNPRLTQEQIWQAGQHIFSVHITRPHFDSMLS